MVFGVKTWSGVDGLKYFSWRGGQATSYKKLEDILGNLGVDQDIPSFLSLLKIVVKFLVLVAYSLCGKEFWCHLWCS